MREGIPCNDASFGYTDRTILDGILKLHGLPWSQTVDWLNSVVICLNHRVMGMHAAKQLARCSPEKTGIRNPIFAIVQVVLVPKQAGMCR